VIRDLRLNLPLTMFPLALLMLYLQKRLIFKFSIALCLIIGQ
jgi:hypothetical protein